MADNTRMFRTRRDLDSELRERAKEWMRVANKNAKDVTEYLSFEEAFAQVILAHERTGEAVRKENK